MNHREQRELLVRRARAFAARGVEELRQGGEMSLRTGTKVRTSLPRLQAAIAAIDAGTYGICTDCEQPIPEARLRAVPGALRCRDCQETHDERR